MKTIFLVNDRFPPEDKGGAAVVVDQLARHLSKTYKVVVVCASEKRSTIKKKKNLIIETIKANEYSKWRSYLTLYNNKINKEFRKIFWKYHPTIVHVHNVHQFLSYSIVPLAKSLGARVIFTSHDTQVISYNRLNKIIDNDGDEIPDSILFNENQKELLFQYKYQYNPLRNFIIKQLLSQADYITTVSDLLREAFEFHNYHNIIVIPNGTDFSFWSLEDEKFDEIISLKNTVLFCGRVRKDKGIYLLLPLIKKLNCNLVIAGPDDFGIQQLFNVAVKENIIDKIHYVGNLNQEELRSLYKSVNVVVTPSICLDTFSNITLESIASKTPVLVSKFCGISRMIDGLQVFNPYNQPEFESLLKKNLKSKKTVEEFVNAKQLFNIDVIASQYEKLYFQEDKLQSKV